MVDILRAQREGPAGVARRQRRRLQDLVAFARLHSPLLRERYEGLPPGPVTLADLPILGKRELMDDFDHWVTDPTVTRTGVEAFMSDPRRIGAAYEGSYFVCQSSGTTGLPGLFVHDQRSVRAYATLSLRIDLAWLSARDWWAFATRRHRWIAVVGTGGHYAGEGWMEVQRKRDRVRQRSFGVIPLQTALPRLVTRLNALDPAALTSYPSELDILSREQAAGRLRIRPVLLEAGGESIAPAVRQRIESAFGVPLRETYSSSEFLTIAYSCDQGWLHVNSDWVILEPVDANGRPTPVGEPSHTVLLTHLANTVQPLIRYDLGDSILVQEGPCRCGDRLPALRVHGRTGDVLRLPGVPGDMVAIAPLGLATVAEQVEGVRRVQLLQEAPARLLVRLEVHPGAAVDVVWPMVRQAVTSYLAAQGVTDPQVDFDRQPPRTNGTTGKFQEVIPLRSPAPT